MFAGIQYDACSWDIKFLAQRYISSDSDPNNPSTVTGPLDNAYMVKFELKGLGGMGTSGFSDRLSMISGYSEDSGFN